MKVGTLLVSLCLAAPVAAQEVGSFAFVCTEPDDPSILAFSYCEDYPDHQAGFAYLRGKVEAANKLLVDVGARFPDFNQSDQGFGPEQLYVLAPRLTGEGNLFWPTQSGALQIPPDGASTLDANRWLRRYGLPAIQQLALDYGFDPTPSACGGWLYWPLTSGLMQYVAGETNDAGVEDYLRYESLPPPKFDTSLHNPTGASGCTPSEPRGAALFEDGHPLSSWAFFYDALIDVRDGDAIGFFSRRAAVIHMFKNIPVGVTEAMVGGADERAATVVALHAYLTRWDPRGLTHFYPTVVARYMNPGAPERARVPFFTDFQEKELNVGETLTFEGQRVAALATEAYAIRLAADPEPFAKRRLVVDVQINDAEASYVDDLHIILNGEVGSDVVSTGGLGEAARAVRMVTTIDDPGLDRALIGVVQVPENIAAATIGERLQSRNYSLKVTLERVEDCDIALFNQFTNVRYSRMTGNVNAIGQTSLPIGQENGPRTSGTADMISSARSVVGGTVCVDHLGQTRAGHPVISIYTPSPLVLMGGGIATLAVEHPGWERWPADSSFAFSFGLPDVTVDDLEAGRTYRALPIGMIGTGFAAAYTEYQGQWQEAGGGAGFVGKSLALHPKESFGSFRVTERDAGFLRGELTMNGLAETLEMTHTRDDGSDGPRFLVDTDGTAIPFRIRADLTVEATDDVVRMIRLGATYDAAVLD